MLSQSAMYLSFQSMGEGQAARVHVTEIVEGLRRRGWSVDLMAPQYSWVSTGFSRRIAEFARLNIVGAVRMVAKRPSVLYVRNHFAALPVALVARAAGVPVIQEVNGPLQDLVTVWPAAKPFATLLGRLNEYQLKVATLVIANTPGLARDLTERLGLRACEVVANGANVEVFRADARTDRQLPARYVFFFGAFSKWQGIDSILSALDSETWPKDVGVVFAGDGQLRPAVEARVASDPRVLYLGILPQKEIAGVLARSIAGLCPKSGRYGHADVGLSPLKLFEILAAERPVVASRVPGLFEIVEENDCGIVVPPDSPEEIASAVARLASDPELAASMGRRGRRVVVSEHSWEARARETGLLLTRLVAEAG